MQQMQCMIEIGPDSIRLGGHHNKVIEFNTRKGQVVSKVRSTEILNSSSRLINCFLVFIPRLLSASNKNYT